MDDVRRLFRALVSALADHPDRLEEPFEVSEIYQTLVPYRTHRADLQMDSIADYEMAVLRLVAGHHGLAAVEPAEAQEALKAESEAVNPDTGLFREFAGARVRLDESAVAAVLGEELRYAPPEEEEEWAGAGRSGQEQAEAGRSGQEQAEAGRSGQEQAEAEDQSAPPAPPAPPAPAAPAAPPASSAPVFESVEEPDVPTCPDCRADLPRGRDVVFCPYCARQLKAARCRHCGDHVEPGWQYCVTCGNPMTG